MNTLRWNTAAQQFVVNRIRNILYPVTAQGGGARQEETYVHKNLPKKRQKMPLISKKMAFHQIKNLLVPIVYL